MLGSSSTEGRCNYVEMHHPKTALQAVCLSPPLTMKVTRGLTGNRTGKGVRLLHGQKKPHFGLWPLHDERD